MLINILKTFVTENRTYREGENIDVPRELAKKWVDDGYASYDTDGELDSFGKAVRNAVGGAGARADVLNGASAGTSSAWLPIAAYPERLAYALDSGSTATTFSVDISADGSTSLGQAFTGTWASTTAHITPPLSFTNPQARYFRFNVLSGGPLSVSRGF